MRLTVLGCNGPYPAPKGSCSGYLVEAGDASLQLDLGCGTLPRLTERMPPETLTALLLSHWHGDHCSDLLPLIYRLESVACQKGTAYVPLPVYAPEDPSSPVWQIARVCPLLTLHHVEGGGSFTLGSVRVRAFTARHPVPAVTLRLELEGAALCYTGDTNETADLFEAARGADLLLADGMLPKAQWSTEKPHLSASLCGKLAAEANAGRLVITHLNPEYDSQTLLQEARISFPRTELARVGMRAEINSR